jgi:hypothetical protein
MFYGCPQQQGSQSGYNRPSASPSQSWFELDIMYLVFEIIDLFFCTSLLNSSGFLCKNCDFFRNPYFVDDFQFKF